MSDWARIQKRDQGRAAGALINPVPVKPLRDHMKANLQGLREKAKQVRQHSQVVLSYTPTHQIIYTHLWVFKWCTKRNAGPQSATSGQRPALYAYAYMSTRIDSEGYGKIEKMEPRA